MEPPALSSPEARSLGARLRPATERDAEAVAAVQVASWRAAYAGLLPDAYLAELDVAEWAERRRSILAAMAESGAGVTLLAESESRVVGFVAAGPPLAPAPPVTAWLYALYLDPPWWGLGLGHALHEAAMEALRAGGYARAELWVLRGNERAIGFYRRHGWSRDGREQLDRSIPGVELDEIGLSRLL